MSREDELLEALSLYGCVEGPSEGSTANGHDLVQLVDLVRVTVVEVDTCFEEDVSKRNDRFLYAQQALSVIDACRRASDRLARANQPIL